MTGEEAAPPSHRASLAAGATGLAAFAVYLATLAPSVPAGDSGELITVAATAGVAHPPGYPLFTLLGRAWITLLPFGEPAWRMNLLSAVCMAVAVGLLARAVARLGGSAVAGAVAGFAFAFAPAPWKMAVVAEVFALHALLAAGLLEAFARVLERAHAPAAAGGRNAARPLQVMAWLTGLAVAHHHTLGLLAVPLDLVALALVAGPPRLVRRLAPGAQGPWPPGAARSPWLLAMLLVGLAPIAWIPLAAANTPPLSWGDVRDGRDLLRLLLRVDYGTFRLDPLAAGYEVAVDHGMRFVRSLPRAIGWAGIALALAGVAALARRRTLAVALVAFAALQALFFTRIGFPLEPAVLQGVVERFHVLPILIVASVAGLGAAFVLETLSRAGGAVRVLASSALVAAVALPSLASHRAPASQRGNRFVEHLARDVLAGVPPGAVLFTQGDLFHNSLAWLLHVEGQRPDVTLVDQELLTFDWYVRHLRRRHPDVLPPLGGGERLTLAAGTVLEGVVLEERADTLVVLAVDGPHAVARRDVVARERPDPASLYAPSRAGFRTSALSPGAEDRYSGLPGTVNLHWLDHLRGRRAAAFVGLKDDSWALRYEMIPNGHVLVAHERGGAPAISARVDSALAHLATFRLDDALVEYEPWSFEQAERVRVRAFATRAALLLCQPEALTPERTGHPGLARLGRFLDRFERLEPTPDPELLRAAGLLRVFHPGFRDPDRARAVLDRALAALPAGPPAEEARRVRAGLGAR